MIRKTTVARQATYVKFTLSDCSFQFSELNSFPVVAKRFCLFSVSWSNWTGTEEAMRIFRSRNLPLREKKISRFKGKHFLFLCRFFIQKFLWVWRIMTITEIMKKYWYNFWKRNLEIWFAWFACWSSTIELIIGNVLWFCHNLSEVFHKNQQCSALLNCCSDYYKELEFFNLKASTYFILYNSHLSNKPTICIFSKKSGILMEKFLFFLILSRNQTTVVHVVI